MSVQVELCCACDSTAGDGDFHAVDRIGAIFLAAVVHHKPIVPAQMRHPWIAKILGIDTQLGT
ncbi:hypothetical protein UC8_43320 [Roseimaritima ulvae]|uniref:Uncharacterized protein n=1 Tax=Roseimaritima ulvae TaxID=980254 RepID=A0A5B9QTG0_9BACT|nr:hypothetical protein UC8_43320 [Roseimaritima ulvae]